MQLFNFSVLLKPTPRQGSGYKWLLGRDTLGKGKVRKVREVCAKEAVGTVEHPGWAAARHGEATQRARETELHPDSWDNF